LVKLTQMPDDALPPDTIPRARAGELAALEEIVRRFERPVRAWVAAHCPPGGDSDEVAQKTFIAVFTRLHEFEEGTSFPAWLFTIARYQLMTETTRLRRVADYHTRYAPDLLDRELERRATDPPAAMTARLAHLLPCLEAMGGSSRRFIEWRYTEQIPLQEMAERTGRSVAAVKKQLWLLRQKLQECIEQKLAAEEGGAA
jgi:RNA polymerase sigma-70 factor (ECF subfamily)